MDYRLVIFDYNGTLTTTQSGQTFPETAADWKLLPGRKEKLQQLKAESVCLAIATNQGGVAFDKLKQSDILREIQKTAGDLMIPEGGVYICYNHPKASLPEYRHDDHRRKPNAGMLLEAMFDFECSADETLMVGDRPEDEEAAKNAGCAFVWAHEFFGDGH